VDRALADPVDPRQLAVLGATAVLSATSFGACADGRPPRTDRPPAALPVTRTTAASVVGGLATYGVDVGPGVLIDVAGDGRDRFLRARRNGVADFGGTGRNNSTLMVLRPAATRAAGRVVINAPRWDPELGDGYCVAQSSGPALLVQPCRPGAPNQIWHVVPVGDSGQFRLDGRYGAVRVDGRTGLQTVPFTG
jgi:hypothetical protein